MKKELLEALKAKFVGVSDKILDRIAEKLAKTVTTTEGVASAVEGVTFQQILDSYGDSRATEATQTAISNYEKKYGLKDGKVKEGEGDETKKKDPKKEDDDETPAYVKELIEANKKLNERLGKIETERTSTARKQKLSKILEKLPESLRKGYERMALDGTDEEFATKLTEIETEISRSLTLLICNSSTSHTSFKQNRGSSGVPAVRICPNCGLSKILISFFMACNLERL